MTCKRRRRGLRDPQMHVVIVQTSAWPEALGGGPDIEEENALVTEAIAHAVGNSR